MPHPDSRVLRLLRLSDSQYPTGAFAHSFGLEQMCADGWLKSAQDVEDYLVLQVVPGLCALEIPMFLRAHEAARARDIQALLRIDEDWDAWRSAPELRAASRRLGKRRLELLIQQDPAGFAATWRDVGAPCHALVVHAIELADEPVDAAIAAFAYGALSVLSSAAMKLVRIGPDRTQRALGRALEALSLQPISQEPAWFNPLQDVACLRHAHAEQRMFIS